MKKHLNDQISLTGRLLVAFASGALLAVYFLPAWRIDLFAPQYPEGLSMYIWINKLTGDVDIINGLNHYIGMKHISADMFPEFRYLPWVVAFFIGFGMLAAITGKRKILLTYVILTIIGGLFVPYDLYRWGYSYGHELDPKAAIQVPGLSYQPPVFGHKRLLNFDAYSFPDVAGWIVVGAGILAAAVLIVEWMRYRKMKKNWPVAIGIPFLFLLSSCGSSPEPFTAGKDNCHVCKMGIMDLHYGGELITTKGKVYKFDDTRCMISFLHAGTIPEKEIRQLLLINYEKPNTFIEAGTATLLISPSLKSPMGSNTAAFENSKQAENFRKNQEDVLINWTGLTEKSR